DDVQAECRVLCDALGAYDFDARWALNGADALDELSKEPFDVVVTDLNMPKLNGVELCRQISEARPHLPVIVVTAFGSIDSAVEAMKAGAYDFITKPFDVDAVALAVQRAAEHHALKQEVAALRKLVRLDPSYGRLVGTRYAMRHVYEMIDCALDTDAPILITGESGTGKELVAREIHERSREATGPFVAFNCAGTPESLLESELFGHVRGAFPEAQADREGLMLSANGGTFLLDEIGDMPLALQPRLLRTLQERTIRPVGGAKEIPFTARVIATTNRDLDAAVESGRLRGDLFYRINVIHIPLPPLRTRAGDILLLAQTFLAEFAIRGGKIARGFTARAAERLLAFDWPGNVRELRNCIERAVALSRNEEIDLDALPERIRDYSSKHVLVASDDPSELISMEQVERRYIIRVVEACRGNKSQAARILGIGRKTLYRKLTALGIPTCDDEGSD
ncbi:MAG TPA: sigma-54 dependent transcriptional regulator, partial [Polyangiaceae bacterium]|nr:sigma-54 dependent transcriptional regulator [Polyangiaceae bacterium]